MSPDQWRHCAYIGMPIGAALSGDGPYFWGVLVAVIVFMLIEVLNKDRT